MDKKLVANNRRPILQRYFTFQQEGQKAGRYFSGKAHKPPGRSSGVTIGRGYDLGQKTPRQIFSDMRAIGVTEDSARLLSQASKKQGLQAEQFIDTYKQRLPILSFEQEKQLFERIYTDYEQDTKRLVNKPDVQARYGVTNWDNLDPKIKTILIDLRFRGDYTPETRKKIQPFVVNNDVVGFHEALSDSSYWQRERGVPRERFVQREKFFDLI